MTAPNLSHLTPTVFETLQPEEVYAEVFLDIRGVQEALRRTETYRSLAEECRQRLEDDPEAGGRWSVDVLVPVFLQELEGPIRTLARIVAFSLLHADGQAPSYAAFREERRYISGVLDACSEVRPLDPALADLLSMFEPGQADSLGTHVRNAAGHADFRFEHDSDRGPLAVFINQDLSIAMPVQDFLEMFEATQDAAIALARVVDEALQRRAAEKD